MKQRIVRLLCALVCAALVCVSQVALAQEVFTINVDALDMGSLSSDAYVREHLSAGAQAVRVSKFLAGADEPSVPVRLTLMQMDSHTLILDKDYGYQNGIFDSGIVYLPFVDNRTIPYLITLYVGDMVYAVPFMQLQPRLYDNGACLRGVRLRELDNSFPEDWMMGAVVDLNALAGGSATLDLCAGNRSLIGTATVSVQGGRLCVETSYLPAANVQEQSAALYVVTDQMPLSALYGPAYSVGERVDVSGAQCALLYLNLRLSYDPADLPAYAYDAASAQNQADLWHQSRAAAAPVGEASPAEADSKGWTDNDGWVDDGGWTDNSGWVDNGGWTDNSGWVDDGGWTDNSGWVDDGGWTDNDGWVDNGGWEYAPDPNEAFDWELPVG